MHGSMRGTPAPEPMSLVEARSFFKAMDGSWFHMTRDDPVRAAAYVALGIPREVEKRWRAELIAARAATLLGRTTAPDALGYARLARLIEDHRSAEALSTGYDVAAHLAARLDAQGRVIVAEAISGGSAPLGRRAGLIFLAHDLGMAERAQALSALCRALCADLPEERASGVLRRCAAIEALLGA